jgi:hypothetical protein
MTHFGAVAKDHSASEAMPSTTPATLRAGAAKRATGRDKRTASQVAVNASKPA